MLTAERATQLRAAIATLKAEGRNPSYHAIQSLVHGKYATLCKDLRELAAADAHGPAEPPAETGDAAPGSAEGTGPLPWVPQTPEVQLAHAEAVFLQWQAELAAATAHAAQWTQQFLSIEPRIRLGTLAPQDPSIAKTREAFEQARARYRQVWEGYTAAEEDVQAARKAVEAAAAQAAELARRYWAEAKYPELFLALARAKRALEVRRADRDPTRARWDERGGDVRLYSQVADLEKQIRAKMAEAPAVA